MNRGPAVLSCLVLAVAVGGSPAAASTSAAGYPALGLHRALPGLGLPLTLRGDVHRVRRHGAGYVPSGKATAKPPRGRRA